VTDLSPGEANDRARAKSEAALTALDSVDVPDSQATAYLRDLAEFVVERER
jgi:geranylgeranyl diphosphate synthase type I